MKVFIETYGCTFNQADSEIMAGILAKEGMELVDDVVDAELKDSNSFKIELNKDGNATNDSSNINKKDEYLHYSRKK